MVNKVNIATDVNVIGHNYQYYKFLNGEQYTFYFYVDYFDNRISMSIYNPSGMALIEDRQLTLSENLCEDVAELKGIFMVEGDEPVVSTIDNISNLYYVYKDSNV